MKITGPIEKSLLTLLFLLNTKFEKKKNKKEARFVMATTDEADRKQVNESNRQPRVYGYFFNTERETNKQRLKLGKAI